MALLDIESIRRRLDEQFIPLEPMLTGMRLIPNGDQHYALMDCQHKLGVRFPPSFTDLTARFDFGWLTIGPVMFSNNRDYFDFLYEANQCTPPLGLAWWSGTERPHERMMIANTESFAIVLDVATGVVYAFTHGSDAAHAMFAIADGFEHFVRGVGTGMINRNPDGGNEDLARTIASAVGVDPSNSFWEYLAS